MASQRAESSKTLAAPSPTFANEPRSSTTEKITVYAATCPIAREKGLDKFPALHARLLNQWIMIELNNLADLGPNSKYARGSS